MITKKILVIDDDETILEILQCCLEDLGGWKVLRANSGEEGFRKAINERPDAIILDWMMPEIDGLTFLNLLRLNSQFQSIPVLIVSAKSGLIDRKALSRLGVFGVVSKPFNPMFLVDQVATCLDSRLTA